MSEADAAATWTEVFDVVVVGYGFAGGVAAIAAADAGSSVVILEKMPFPGGLSVTSGGGLAAAHDAEGAFRYLRHTCDGTTSDAVLRAMAQGMVELPDYLRHLEQGSTIRMQDERATADPGGHNMYHFPGAQSIRSMKMARDPNFAGFPWVKGMRGGARLFKLVYDNVETRRIPVRLNAAARRLLTEGAAVVGVETQAGRIGARQAVVLACGGFENSEELKLQYAPGRPIYGVTGTGNTGDGIRMAMQVGADLWHMWHLHGSYGFKFPEYRFAFRHRIAGPRVPTRLMPWILVDQRGRRFMNEYPPAPQDTAIRALLAYDPDTECFPRIPAFMLLDDAGRRTGPIGFPIFQGDDEEPYVWSEDNLKEIERGWLTAAPTLRELASRLGLPADAVEESAADWNAACRGEHPDRFARLPGTMMPIAEPPFIGAPVWPLVSNTQGGPVHDEHQRVIDVYGRPIEGLYAAGELGSLFGHLYLEAGNVGECFVTGRIAGGHAAAIERRLS